MRAQESETATEPPAADAKTFTLEAVRGSLTNGIVSGPFLEYAFRTERCTLTVTINANGT